MNWLLKLFGSAGTVHFEAVTISGICIKGKIKIESIGLTKSEIEESLKDKLFAETGLRFKKVVIIKFEK